MWLPPWWRLVFRAGGRAMWWVWGPGGGSVSRAVAPFVSAGAARGGVGGAGAAGGLVVGDAAVDVGVRAVFLDRPWALAPAAGRGGPRPGDVRGAVSGERVSRLVAGALRSPM